MRQLLDLLGPSSPFTLRSSSCARPKRKIPVRGDAVEIGIVFDVGGRGDKSFNDGAYLGAERAAKQLGANVRFIEPGEGSERETELLAAQSMDLVVGVGFIFTDDLHDMAAEYPNVRFAGVDYALQTDAQGNVIPPPPNLAALQFREEQGSFLVGALAALVRQNCLPPGINAVRFSCGRALERPSDVDLRIIQQGSKGSSSR
jgi:basic membrane lipoprotein Med (substrate-binding protein (PBP1-ABC) superfamily)